MTQIGKSYHIYSMSIARTIKAHVMYILDGAYPKEKLIVYRFFGKHKRWWHVVMIDESRFLQEMQFAKDDKLKAKQNG